MGNKKGYTPSDESKKKVSESLKLAYAEGRHRGNGFEEADSEEWRRKIGDGLKKAYAEGRKTLTGAALEQSLAPKKSKEERHARKMETQKAWREKNPEKYSQYYQKYYSLDYGLTAEQYEVEVATRQGLCDVCKRPQQSGIRLAIDHDHNCCPERAACEKCRRGLLCTNCNTLLGSAHDSVEILQNAILYLASFKKEKSNAERIDHPETS